MLYCIPDISGVFRVRFLRRFDERFLRPFKWSKAAIPTCFDVRSVATKSYDSPGFRFLRRRNQTLNTLSSSMGFYQKFGKSHFSWNYAYAAQ